MLLQELVSALEMQEAVEVRARRAKKSQEVDVGSVVYDSRKAGAGVIFACVVGEHCDGHDFAPAALEKGAEVLLVSRFLNGLDAVQIRTSDPRASMGRVAAILEGNPSESLTMIGVTGTNGKTTSTYMIRSILRSAGIKTGMIGTIVTDDGERQETSKHTTPEGPDIQAALGRMVRNNCQACVMETSSHAIAQERIAGCHFDRAGFTNLTQDHLDFHGTFEAYFEAKKTLLTRHMRGDWKLLANRDDPWGAKLIAEFADRAVSYGLSPLQGAFGAEIHEEGVEGIVFDLVYPDGQRQNRMRLPLLGRHNVFNALQAVSICWSLGVEAKYLQQGIEELEQVPGRLERYSLSNGVTAVVDFSHTPDALAKALEAMREIAQRRLWIVFGAGGDRDAAKRPQMGRIASELADRVVLTMDNPRSEDPGRICAQIEMGMDVTKFAGCETIIDRREAIEYALSSAEAGDIVLIAGKGAEDYLVIGDETFPFQDKQVVLDWALEHGVGIFS